jgi:two-component system, response regulator YesN
MVKLLIVDDDSDLIYILRLQLRDRDIQILEANTGSAALEAVNSVKPDIVITDINLPDCDGKELVKKIKKIIPQSKVGIVTGFPETMSQDIMASSSADFVFSKPIDLEKLKSIIG